MSLIRRQFVNRIYKPPQVDEEEDTGVLVRKYMGDFRRVFIEHPRVRLDGVYIAVCHYMYVETRQNIYLFQDH